MIAGIGTECFITKYSVLDLDVWWHLKVGDWIVEHRAFPHTGILSRTAADRPWMAYSWGYEVLLSRFYAWLDLVGIGAFGTLLTIAVAVGLFWMLHRLSGRFWVAWLLTITSCSAFLFNIMPRPVFFSMLLFSVTLTLLLEARHTGKVKSLYWLPVIFLFWANLHIQFIYGLLAIGLFLAVNLLNHIAERWNVYSKRGEGLTLPVVPLLGVFAGCVLISCVGPYSYHLYQVIFDYSKSKITYTMISELQALSFKGPSHFLELFLAAAAFFVVGCRNKLDLFKLVLLVAASVLAFRTTRDAWFLCITAAAIVADFPISAEKRDRQINLQEALGVTLAAMLLLMVTARNWNFNRRGLDQTITGQFPVNAVNYLRRNPVGGPMYNSFDFGGFLTFYMPQYPVAIDGRNDLYGDEIDAKFYSSETADPSYTADSFLNEAGVVILKSSAPLAKLLPTDGRFRVVYRDEVAEVLARR